MTNLVTTVINSNHTLVQLDDGKANALSFDMLAAVNSALDEVEHVGKPIIIAGRAGKFCAGFDLNVMRQGGDDTRRILREGGLLSYRLLCCDVPVILAVSGHALAMGALLLLSADYRIGLSGEYKIGLNEVAIGLTMPYFGVELARNRIASGHLQSALTMAKIYDSAGAVEAGFLDELVDENDLITRAESLADQLAGLDAEAHKNTKARLRSELRTVIASAIDEEFGTG